MPLLFCFGSNNPRQLTQRVGPPKGIYAAFAPYHKRVFRGWSRNWQGGVATLVPSTSRPAYGYAAELSMAQIKDMDEYEGVSSGLYTRRLINVVVDIVVYDQDAPQGEERQAYAYLKESTEFNAPSLDYLKAVAATIGTFWQINGPQDIKIE